MKCRNCRNCLSPYFITEMNPTPYCSNCAATHGPTLHNTCEVCQRVWQDGEFRPRCAMCAHYWHLWSTCTKCEKEFLRPACLASKEAFWEKCPDCRKTKRFPGAGETQKTVVRLKTGGATYLHSVGDNLMEDVIKAYEGIYGDPGLQRE